MLRWYIILASVSQARPSLKVLLPECLMTASENAPKTLTSLLISEELALIYTVIYTKFPCLEQCSLSTIWWIVNGFYRSKQDKRKGFHDPLLSWKQKKSESKLTRTSFPRMSLKISLVPPSAAFTSPTCVCTSLCPTLCVLFLRTDDCSSQKEMATVDRGNDSSCQSELTIASLATTEKDILSIENYYANQISST